jgi:aldehyde:ferredoxin oxidoreductase
MKKYLIIDLTRKRTECREIPPPVLSDYPSGAALATYLLSAHMTPGTGALAPESAIVLATGLFAGLPYPGATRFALAAKSPQTECWAGGSMGGEFAWALRCSGWSAIVVHGQATEWSYLFLDEGKAYFRSAATLVGQSLEQTKRELEEMWGREIGVLGVGPAGEAQVRFAALSDGSPERGVRGGLGAIFGSKNLKAVVIRPDEPVRIDQPGAFLRAATPLLKSLGEAGDAPAMEMGTLRALRKLDQAQALPSHNFQRTGFERSWFDTVEHLPLKKKACTGCALACVNLYLWVDDPHGGRHQTDLPLFPEHLWALGPVVDVFAVEESFRALKCCMDAGMDPVSFGVVAAWAAECLEKGISLGVDLGPAPGFGHGPWLNFLSGQMTKNSQVRDLLGLGALKAAEKVGKGARDLAVHFSGQELSYIDPRTGSLLLSYLGPAFEMPASNNFLNRNLPEREAASGIIEREDRWALLETLGLCPWAWASQADPMVNIATFVQLVTGIHISIEMLAKWGKNCLNLIKTFDWREGWRPYQLNLARKFFQQDLVGSGKTYAALDPDVWRKNMDEYFSSRCWSDEGEPLLMESG